MFENKNNFYKNELNPEKIIRMLYEMILIREFENTVGILYQHGLVTGLAHLYNGEEAIAVGVCTALTKNDYILSTHRGHGHCIAKGGDIKKMMAELLGRYNGYNKGKGGSMHIADPNIGMLGANGIVGAGLPIATGAALSAKLRKSGQAVVCFHGDGATNQGVWHESLNMASTWVLPVVYVCENNLYAVTTPISRTTNIENLADRAKAYGIPGVVVDGQDVLAVYKVAKESVERARTGNGPSLIEAKTYRFEGHGMGDVQFYRTKQEVQEWKKRDPILILEDFLKIKNIITDNEINKIREEIKQRIEESVDFAKNSPEPGIETLMEGLFV